MILTSFIPLKGSTLTAMTVGGGAPLTDHTGRRIGRVKAVTLHNEGMSVTVEIEDEEAQRRIMALPPVSIPQRPGGPPE